MHLDQKISLKALHTFGMDVEARYFVEAKSHAEVMTLLNYRHMIHMPILILGGGSNVLFTRNFAGLVVRINTRGIEVVGEDALTVSVKVQAGEPWDAFVQHCVDHGRAGLENLSLIPGCVGAAPVQNIGAYGVEVKELIEKVHFVDITTGKHHDFSREECCFGYRDSIFKSKLKGKIIITEVIFRLLKADIPDVLPSLKLDYGDIRPELREMHVTDPTIGDVREAICRIRRRKLPDPAEIGNAGSFFKNPVISREHWNTLHAAFPDLPEFSNPDPNLVKIPAAWLIDQCGWKGYRNGSAGVHVSQPLVLVNYGNATGQEILNLANLIIDSVKERFGIGLEMEVNVF